MEFLLVLRIMTQLRNTLGSLWGSIAFFVFSLYSTNLPLLSESLLQLLSLYTSSRRFLTSSHLGLYISSALLGASLVWLITASRPYKVLRESVLSKYIWTNKWTIAGNMKKKKQEEEGEEGQRKRRGSRRRRIRRKASGKES